MRWWWVLGVGVMGSALAQDGGKGLSDAERAKRDAEKVFSFIKFQTVKKPSAAPAAAPSAAAPSPRLAPARSDATPTARSKPAAPEPGVAAAQASAPSLASAPATVPQIVPEASRPQGAAAEDPARPALGAPVQPPAAAAPPPTPEPEPEEQEVELKLVDFVAPELTPQIQATLGASSPVVKLRFMVGTDGKVQSARAVEGVPRRLGQVAERAVLQWRFEPLPAAREVEVEIAFKR
ncbi:TonB family protein [Inhella sp.]|uniref:TonB family protein n=1 Tax=Inhella sp. TaxID=1921806 RepID=UPI0035B08E60